METIDIICSVKTNALSILGNMRGNCYPVSIGINAQTLQSDDKMQNANSNHNVQKTISMRISQHYIWSIPTPSAPSSIICFINHQFTPPFYIFNICNNISVNKQANIASNRRSVIAPVRSLSFLESFVAGYFICRRWDISTNIY